MRVSRTVRLFALAFTMAGSLVLAGCAIAPGPGGGPGTVNLRSASNYVILAETTVTNTGATAVTGNIGLSPAATSFLTGFAHAMDTGGAFATSPYVTGRLYAADMAAPTPSVMTTAIIDMRTAYTTAAGLPNPTTTELGAGDISGRTINPGLHKWGTGVLISTHVTLWGSSTATWVFQIADSLTVASGARVILSGGARPENIVWQVGSNAALGTGAAFAGTLMTAADIAVRTGATVNGRLFAQTAVTLEANTVTAP